MSRANAIAPFAECDLAAVADVPAVYALIRDASIIYIGTTAKLKSRLNQHRPINFTSVGIIPGRDLQLEGELIRKFRPPLNYNHNRTRTKHHLLAARLSPEETRQIRAEIDARSDLFGSGRGALSDFVRHAVMCFLEQSRREREAKRCK